MTEQQRHAVRLATISLVLLSGERLTAKDIARRWRVSIRTAQRDLLSVEEMIPLVVKPIGSGNRELGIAAMRPCIVGLAVIR